MSELGCAGVMLVTSVWKPRGEIGSCAGVVGCGLFVERWRVTGILSSRQSCIFTLQAVLSDIDDKTYCAR